MTFIKLIVGYIVILIGAIINIIFIAPFSFLFEIPGNHKILVLTVTICFIIGLIPYVIGLLFLLFKGKKYIILNIKLIIIMQIIIYLYWIISMYLHK